jgi:hypothetical protein
MPTPSAHTQAHATDAYARLNELQASQIGKCAGGSGTAEGHPETAERAEGRERREREGAVGAVGAIDRHDKEQDYFVSS